MSYRNPRSAIFMTFGAALLTACTGGNRAPIEQKAALLAPPAAVRAASAPAGPGTARPETYRVQAGDTLYSIAWRYGIDYRRLAAWNGLADPDRILVGQRLRLRAPAPGTLPPSTPRAAATSPLADAAAPRALPLPEASVARSRTDVTAERADVTRADARLAPAQPTRVAGGLAWNWPAEGNAFRAVSASGSIGLEIKGVRGQPIKAAAAGQVVYSGNGLRGYGQLIIIKHSETYLSAYAHNDQLLVTEGKQVRPGQQIALMGDSEADEVMLHFEIRRGGKAVEPLQYLPKR